LDFGAFSWQQFEHVAKRKNPNKFRFQTFTETFTVVVIYNCSGTREVKTWASAEFFLFEKKILGCPKEKSKHERQQNFFCLKRKFLGVQKRSQNMSVSRIFSVWKENSWVSEILNRPDFGHLMYICTTYLKNVFYFFSFFSLRFNGSANCASLVTGPSNVSWGQTSTTTQMICLPLAL
jgi:hypothetical protein